MAKADVTSLVSQLATGQSDATAVSSYYDRIVQEHGRSRGTLTDAAFVAIVAGTSSYARPSAALSMLAFFYDDLWLFRERKQGVEQVDDLWRVRRGEPRAVMVDDQSSATFSLVPVPSRSGATIGVSTPFSGAFPSDNVTVIYAAAPVDVHPWEELAQTCEILAREFGRDSEHADEQSRVAWRQLATLLWLIVDRVNGTNPSPA
jgi:hypothetical protein